MFPKGPSVAWLLHQRCVVPMESVLSWNLSMSQRELIEIPKVEMSVQILHQTLGVLMVLVLLLSLWALH